MAGGWISVHNVLISNAAALQAVGLETTTATKGAFLIHTTALFTPLIAGLTGSKVSGVVWLATLLGAGGTVLFSGASHPAADAVQQSTPQFGGGSLLSQGCTVDIHLA